MCINRGIAATLIAERKSQKPPHIRKFNIYHSQCKPEYYRPQDKQGYRRPNGVINKTALDILQTL